jgi:hypothetical protein
VRPVKISNPPVLDPREFAAHPYSIVQSATDFKDFSRASLAAEGALGKRNLNVPRAKVDVRVHKEEQDRKDCHQVDVQAKNDAGVIKAPAWWAADTGRARCAESVTVAWPPLHCPSRKEWRQVVWNEGFIESAFT